MNDKKGFYRGLLDDEEFALLDLDLISIEDEYSVRIGDNSRSFKLLQEAKQLSHALIQTDKVRFSTLLDLLDSDNLSEFKDQLRGVEKELEERDKQMQEQQQAHEQQMQEAAMKEQEAMRKQRMDEIDLKGHYDIETAKIKAMSWNEDKDIDDNGIPDMLEYEKFQAQVGDMNKKIELQKQKLEQDNRKLDQKDDEMSMKREQMSNDVAKNMRDNELKEKALKAKKTDSSKK